MHPLNIPHHFFYYGYAIADPFIMPQKLTMVIFFVLIFITLGVTFIRTGGNEASHTVALRSRFDIINLVGFYALTCSKQ